MSISYQDASEKCINLGIKFILNFKKICEDPENKDISKLVNEMNNWYNTINSLKLKPSNKSLSIVNKVDLFFCAGTEPINIIDDIKITSDYDIFIEYLISGMTVHEAINKILVKIKK